MKILSENEFSAEASSDRNNFSFLSPFLKWIFRFDKLNATFDQADTTPGLPFLEAVLEQLGVTYEIYGRELENIPKKGAFIAIANHACGDSDSLLMLQLLTAARPESKIMAQMGLKKILPLQDYIIPVNPFKAQNNLHIPGISKALDLLQQGIPVGIFPAGEVSNLLTGRYKMEDPEWQQGLAGLIMKARVPVLPVFFSGNTSPSGNIFGLNHPLVHKGSLPSELINKNGHQIEIHVGKPIPFAEINKLVKEEVVPYLRAKTYGLGPEYLIQNPFNNFIRGLPAAKPIIAETEIALIRAELNALPSRNLLFTHHQYQVYIAAYSQIPHVMREIGRLREIAFRAVGEGTNQEMDLDIFDQHYLHAFVYDTRASLLVGAYRLGKGKKILRQFGKSGFYLHSLFKMKKEFTPVLKQSLELGRFFVRLEYQQKTLPPIMLWLSVTLFLEGKTNYRYLLGPVSISDYFSDSSKALMVNFIKEHCYDQELARFISPRKKFSYRASKYYSESGLKTNIRVVNSVDDLIAELAPKHCWLPVQLKKYLRQNAKVIGFNTEPKYAGSLDGLLMIQVKDLPDVTRLLLNRKNREEVKIS